MSGAKLPARVAPPPPRKRTPPPRPPPPVDGYRPARFDRRPTVLAALRARPTRTDDVAALIDLSSPSPSPTPTARSSSDALSVDSFGSDGTGHAGGGGSASQPESGFEDDFDATFDPFSPTTVATRARLSTKPPRDSDFLDPLCNGETAARTVHAVSAPTIIRAKPKRPKQPNDSSLLARLVAPPAYRRYDEREASPPMPNVPPPPPPTFANEEPYAIAAYDFPGAHDDDLPFKVNDKIRLLRRIDDEWYYGKLRCGMEGTFPASFVDVKIDLSTDDDRARDDKFVTASYDFYAHEVGDLNFRVGTRILVLYKLNNDWLYGKIGSNYGQFPSNYVDHVPTNL